MINTQSLQREEVRQNQLVFSLDNENKVAAVVSNDDATGDIYIPKLIKHNGKEYIVNSISKWAFKNSKTIHSIQFPPDSMIKSIEYESFAYSTIKSIMIPESLSELQECWCSNTSFLTKVKIMPKNEKFICLNDKMIVGKSEDEYDVLFFVCRDAEKIIVPSFIKKIASYAFSETTVETVFLPPHLTHICECAFFNCKKIKQIKIPPNSELRIVEKNAFLGTSIDPTPISLICKRNEKLFLSSIDLMKFSIMQNDEKDVLDLSFSNHSKNESLMISKEMDCENNEIHKKLFQIPEITLSKSHHDSHDQLIHDLNYYSNLIYIFIEKFSKDFNESNQLSRIIFDISSIIPIKCFFDNLSKESKCHSLDFGIILSLLKSVLSCIFLINKIIDEFNKSRDEIAQIKSVNYDLLNKEKMKGLRQCKKTKHFNQKYTNFKKYK